MMHYFQIMQKAEGLGDEKDDETGMAGFIVWSKKRRCGALNGVWDSALLDDWIGPL